MPDIETDISSNENDDRNNLSEFDNGETEGDQNATINEYEDIVDILQPPTIVKYMGSKRDLLDFIHETILEFHDGEPICDLFAGTAIVGGSLRNVASILSNDIQEYSQVFARTYLSDVHIDDVEKVVDDILLLVRSCVERMRVANNDLNFDYLNTNDLISFQQLEEAQQNLIEQQFDYDYHLFAKFYSGTYWSYDQCLWIDSIREVADTYEDKNLSSFILSSLMYSMAYNAQSTGHYAQYRDANTMESMNDIKTYRLKSIEPFFRRKMIELLDFAEDQEFEHTTSVLDYRDCLAELNNGTLIYADPPYAFVHYSRFYHALETLVRYDYPTVQFKGRYRNDRHQSPFCQKTQVEGAFSELFQEVANHNHKLVLSYSDSGVITLERLEQLIEEFAPNHEIIVRDRDYLHSTMGRLEDKERNVIELLLILIPQNA